MKLRCRIGLHRFTYNVLWNWVPSPMHRVCPYCGRYQEFTPKGWRWKGK